MNDTTQWFKIDDQRPPTVGYYLVACEGGAVAVSFYVEDPTHINAPFMCPRKEFGKWSKHFRLAREYGYKITHWASLPIHPTEGGK